MQCNNCEKEVNKGVLIHGEGFVCEDCKAEAQQRRKDFHAELLAEEIGQMPDNFETEDFERFALKFSLHYLKAMPDMERKKIAKGNALLLVPEEFALLIKEKILAHIPSDYTSTLEARGHMRMFHGGEYRFFRPVPCEVIHKAMKKAKVIN